MQAFALVILSEAMPSRRIFTPKIYCAGTVMHRFFDSLCSLRMTCLFYFFSSFQNSLLKKIREITMAKQPQVMKQSATLNTGKLMNFVSIISTT